MPTAVENGIAKNRFISFVPDDAGNETAIRVKLVTVYDEVNTCSHDHTIDCSQDADCQAGTVCGSNCDPSAICDPDGCPQRQPPLADLAQFDGQVRWLGAPAEYKDLSLSAPNVIVASLECTPYYRDWSPAALAADFDGDGPGPTGNGIDGEPDADVLHVFGAAIVPCSQYEVQAILDDVACAVTTEANYSAPLSISTALWGDVWEPWLGMVNFTDIGMVVEAFKRTPYDPGPPEAGAPPKVRAMLRNNVVPVSGDVTFTDIGRVVDAFKTKSYPDYGPCPCPTVVSCGTVNCNECSSGEGACRSDEDCLTGSCQICSSGECCRDAYGNDPIRCRDECKRCIE